MFAFVTHAGSRVTGVKYHIHYVPSMLHMYAGCLHAIPVSPVDLQILVLSACASRFAVYAARRSRVDHTHSSADSVLTNFKLEHSPPLLLHAVLAGHSATGRLLDTTGSRTHLTICPRGWLDPLLQHC